MVDRSLAQELGLDPGTQMRVGEAVEASRSDFCVDARAPEHGFEIFDSVIGQCRLRRRSSNRAGTGDVVRKLEK